MGEFVERNPEPMKKLFSHREDVSLANPLVPRAGGRVAAIMERAASYLRAGEIVGFENVGKYVTSELAYVVQLERLEAKVGGREEIAPFALRVTMIFRPEEGTWKVVHRHADPITATQPAESVLEE